MWEEQIFPQSGIDHTHYGTHFLKPSAYKARVGGVSPWCGIKQICEGGISSSAHSQSKQYLIGERFVPPTKIRLLGFKRKPPPSPFGLPLRSYVKECTVHASRCANLILAHMITHTMIHPSLGQVLIRQGWKASLLDVRLNKFVRVASAPWPIPKANNTWLGKYSFLP